MSMSFVKGCFETSSAKSSMAYFWSGTISADVKLIPVFLFSLLSSHKMECEILCLNVSAEKNF